ncbi:aconitate hydratase AcnA [Acinetobacter pittii]|uniref:aconitate hydratase AcnA n=1 Tax=Acinetobacter pittii TaxID=48296 RepID=UPI003892CBF7
MKVLSTQFLSEIQIDGQAYSYIDLYKVIKDKQQLLQIPYSLRILLENIARRTPEALPDILNNLLKVKNEACEVPYYPNRIMFHDTTCLPALADFAAMRNVVDELGGNPSLINPLIPAVLTIDHSVIVEHFAEKNAVEKNLDIDFRRNTERYEFIKWAQKSLNNFSVIPPGTGIIHQMNMEAIAQVVWEEPLNNSTILLHPDCMVATDSHTPMINSIGVLGWGVGGLEGQAALVGEPVTLILPKTLGIRVINTLNEGVTATDITLYVAEILRKKNMVGKFVEFTGPGLENLSISARGTIANMAPEYGATVVFFPYDKHTEAYLKITGRDDLLIEKANQYMKSQSLFRDENSIEPKFDELIELDLASIKPSMAGPSLPHQRQNLDNVAASFQDTISSSPRIKLTDTTGLNADIEDGLVLMSAITSCTNTANAFQMIQAGLLARKAHNLGLKRKSWVKTSLSPGSRVVADYLEKANLLNDFSSLGFDLAGFGCMTCIGNSGSLEQHADQWVDQGLKGVVVLSGNRNFSGRVNPKLPAGYLASPALCVAYAIAGTILINLENDPIAYDAKNQPIFLKDLMPTDAEVRAIEQAVVTADLFIDRKAQIWNGTSHWQKLKGEYSELFPWDINSTYLRRPKYLENIGLEPRNNLAFKNAKALFVLGDNVTTDHISPAYSIPANSLAGEWLIKRGERIEDLNQYSTRRSNHEVMLRGAFTNPAIENLQLKNVSDAPKNQGVWAWNLKHEQIQPLYDVAQEYVNTKIPTIVFAGINYGSGSSRDWAAKAQALLGVKAVIAQSIERIHRSNLIGMGILPLLFKNGEKTEDLQLNGNETFSFSGLEDLSVGNNNIVMTIQSEHISDKEIELDLRIDSSQEIRYLINGGILPYVIRKIVNKSGN